MILLNGENLKLKWKISDEINVLFHRLLKI